MQPRVSVILPFHNSQDFLSDAIESILAQSFTDFELLLIDNNSNDESYAIAAEFESKEKRVKLIQEPAQGAVFALNLGIQEAEGEYIARMDADDISYPERLEKQVAYLDANPDTGVVSCQVAQVSTTDNPDLQESIRMYVQWNNKLITHEDMEINRFVESPVIHSTVMYRKELIEQYGGYRNGDFPEDYELWLRWIASGVKMHKLPEVLFDWTDLSDRLTRKDERFTDQALFEVKSRYLYDWLEKNNEYHPEVVVWGAGRKSRQRFYILHELGVQAKFYIDLRANPDRKVIQFQHTPPAGRHFILSYVSNRSAREKIKMFLVELGYIEGKDFICFA